MQWRINLRKSYKDESILQSIVIISGGRCLVTLRKRFAITRFCKMEHKSTCKQIQNSILDQREARAFDNPILPVHSWLRFAARANFKGFSCR